VTAGVALRAGRELVEREALSGGPGSVSPFEDLGQQGRRYVTEVVTPDVISDVLGEQATAHPLRTYVGFNSEPIYPSGRAELALAELDRAGAFDRSYLLIARPDWLTEQRGRGAPDGMPWIPVVTLIQVLIDAANAMVTVPVSSSRSADYRADMARFVLDGFDLPSATEEQVANVDRYLRDLELERAQRIASRSEEAAPPPPAARSAEPLLAGVPLRQRRAHGPRWLGGAARPPIAGRCAHDAVTARWTEGRRAPGTATCRGSGPQPRDHAR
jgi:hypothetical protein